MAEERSLPGWPKKRLVRDVRRHLWHYGIRPKGKAWRAAWAWASAIANSYYHTHWPLPSEIASQYVLLLLADMKGSCSLKFLIVEADTVSDAIDSLADDEQYGHHIVVDEADLGDYDPETCEYSGSGKVIDTDWLSIHGCEGCAVPFPCRYHGDGLPAEGVLPTDFSWDDLDTDEDE